jgi:hypothetical protein
MANMDKRQPPSQPPNDSDGLNDAIRQAEAEMVNITNWMESEVSGSSRSTVGTKTVREQSRKVGEGGIDSGSEILSAVNRISHMITDGEAKSRRQLLIGMIGVSVGTLALIAAVVIGVVSVKRESQRAENRYAQSQLNITFPLDGASVGSSQKIRGATPYLNRNHYLLITSVGTGSVRVEPISVTSDGSFRAEVKFSDSAADLASGKDEEFAVRVLATSDSLEPGSFSKAPDDAILSGPITITRAQTLRIVINAPTDGADIGLDASVTGKTTVPDLNHYIIVKSVKAGISYVQDRPVSVNRTDGTFSGNARLGEAGIGLGEQFVIRVLATKSMLRTAPLVNEPPDAVSSNTITVNRKQ